MTSAGQAKTWFLTGTSRGFGRHWAEVALERGDRVAATARDVADLADLVERYPDTALALPADVTDRAAVFAAVKQAHDHFGRLDVVVSNAGYGLFGAIEEVTEDQARKQIDTNVFGCISVLQAALPILRQQGSGHILITSSFGGLMNFPTGGLYGATKFALEGLGEALAAETKDLGIKVTLIEPSYFGTDFNTSSRKEGQNTIDAYKAVHQQTEEAFKKMEPGDPAHTAPVILKLVDMDEPPQRIILGAGALQMVQQTYEKKLAEWDRWSALGESAQ